MYNFSNNILITSACIGGVLGKSTDEELKNQFIEFFVKNKDRCFLEIGHHIDDKQKKYNLWLKDVANSTGLRLIAGTDTHALNQTHVEGRRVLQQRKNVFFEGEENWDLTFKTYDELVEAYRLQAVLPEDIYLEAIENTNVFGDMIEPFDVDRNPKYPHIYDNPSKVFKDKIEKAIKEHPYASKRYSYDELKKVTDQEIEVFEKTKSVDFMLLQTYLREWEKSQGIHCGPGRGSVSGSMVAYLLGITQMDSIKFNLNFFRFSNPDRVSLADIDTDYGGVDRGKVKEFLLKDKLGLDNVRTAEIITFNTIALRGAIRDVCRGLYAPKDGRLDADNPVIEVPMPKGKRGKFNYIQLADMICQDAEDNIDKARKDYPEVFKYVDIVNGTIVSIGTHPSGVLVSDHDLAGEVGLCSISSSEYPVSMLNMKELDELMFVKLDVLGLDNISLINETCKLLNIPPLTPDSIDLEDIDVWNSIREDTTLIFQWESNSAQQYLKKFMSPHTLQIAQKNIPNFSMLKWMSFGNGLIRPACASFRDSVAKGYFYDNGFDALNEFLAPEAGRIAMQETIMQFLVKFCGYTAAESDTVRRAIAKKKGTETLIPEIKRRFIEYTSANYDKTEEECENIITPFIQIILDASEYGFSWNHSDAYSAIGYMCGYLRYYHPLEFLTAALNIYQDDLEKTGEIIKYGKKIGINVTMPKWGISIDKYICDPERKIIAKGLTSIKFMNKDVAIELYNLAKSGSKDTHFASLLKKIYENTSIRSNQITILISLDFFSEFGNQRELQYIFDAFCNIFDKGNVKKIRLASIEGTEYEDIIKKYCVNTTKAGKPAKMLTVIDVDSMMEAYEDKVKEIHMDDISETARVRNCVEAMGYAGYVTGKEEDRRKLYVTNILPIRSKKTNKIIGRSVCTKSIGSGKESRFTVWNALYDKNPIKKEDVIYCGAYQADGKYFTLTKYDILE